MNLRLFTIAVTAALGLYLSACSKAPEAAPAAAAVEPAASQIVAPAPPPPPGGGSAAPEIPKAELERIRAQLAEEAARKKQGQ